MSATPVHDRLLTLLTVRPNHRGFRLTRHEVAELVAELEQVRADTKEVPV